MKGIRILQLHNKVSNQKCSQKDQKAIDQAAAGI